MTVAAQPADRPPAGELQRQLLRDALALRARRAQPQRSAPGDGSGDDLAVAIAAQLAPVRTRAVLIASYCREAVHSPEVRRAYAVVWLALAHGGPAREIHRRRSRRTAIRRPR